MSAFVAESMVAVRKARCQAAEQEQARRRRQFDTARSDLAREESTRNALEVVVAERRARIATLQSTGTMQVAALARQFEFVAVLTMRLDDHMKAVERARTILQLRLAELKAAIADVIHCQIKLDHAVAMNESARRARGRRIERLQEDSPLESARKHTTVTASRRHSGTPE